MSKNTPPDFFLQASEKLNIPLSEEACLQFETYYQELIAWNKKINLTRITERKKVFIEHFIDSLIPEKFIPAKSSLIDLGSGGGFPGLPLKIIRPDLSVTLVDSSLKKVLFLRYLVRLFNLRGIVALQKRLEPNDFSYQVAFKSRSKRRREIDAGPLTLPLSPAGRGEGEGISRSMTRGQQRYAHEGSLVSDDRYDVCIARAFSSLEKFLPLAFALKNPQGIVIAMKGPNFFNELKVVEPQLPLWGMSLKQLKEFVLPFTNKQRAIIVFG